MFFRGKLFKNQYGVGGVLSGGSKSPEENKKNRKKEGSVSECCQQSQSTKPVNMAELVGRVWCWADGT